MQIEEGALLSKRVKIKIHTRVLFLLFAILLNITTTIAFYTPLDIQIQRYVFGTMPLFSAILCGLSFLCKWQKSTPIKSLHKMTHKTNNNHVLTTNCYYVAHLIYQQKHKTQEETTYCAFYCVWRSPWNSSAKESRKMYDKIVECIETSCELKPSSEKDEWSMDCTPSGVKSRQEAFQKQNPFLASFCQSCDE